LRLFSVPELSKEKKWYSFEFLESLITCKLFIGGWIMKEEEQLTIVSKEKKWYSFEFLESLITCKLFIGGWIMKEEEQLTI